jgi:phosphoglycerol transferase
MPALLAVMLVLGILDQTYDPPSYEPTKVEFASDAAFVGSIEHLLGKQAMVYQLPYSWYPEGTQFVNAFFYDHVRGYLHSSTLRWSYGAIHGRPEADWQDVLVDRPLTDLLDTVAAVGFTGVYVDRYAYDDGATELAKQLAKIASGPPLISPNFRLLLYDIRDYAKTRQAQDPARLAALRRAVLDRQPAELHRLVTE